MPAANAVQVKLRAVQDTVAAGVCASAEAGNTSARSVSAPTTFSVASDGSAGSAAYHV